MTFQTVSQNFVVVSAERYEIFILLKLFCIDLMGRWRIWSIFADSECKNGRKRRGYTSIKKNAEKTIYL